MGVLADFFIADDEQAQLYDADKSAVPKRVEMKRITTLELSMLWAILLDAEWDVALVSKFRCLNQTDGGERSTWQIPNEFLQVLTSNEDALDSAAEKWAATEEMACEPSDAREIIDELVNLAWQVEGSGKNLYLWNCV